MLTINISYHTIAVIVCALINISAILWAFMDYSKDIKRSQKAQLFQLALWIISGLAVCALTGGMEAD